MNKTQKVMQHLLEFKSITSWEAIQQYGATRLSAIIYNLRHKYKLQIENEDYEFIDRYGSKSHYAKYILKENTNEQ